MVYRGKISPDCLPCRKRKLRCDLQRNGCGQCRRAQIVCEGYRDPDQTVFCDETQSAGLKVAARMASRKDQQRQPHSGSGRLANTIATVSSQPLTRFPLAWDVQARDVFFAHYVFGFSRSLDMLAPLYAQSMASEPLVASVDAASLAFFIQQQHSPPPPSLLRLASERYSCALRSLANALASPDSATADATLQAALLLDLYEKLMMHHHHRHQLLDHRSHVQSEEIRQPPRSAWMSHIRGALSLLTLRGSHNTDTYIGRRLASRLVINLTISCAKAEVRLPAALINFHAELSQFHDADPKWAITGLVAEMVLLRADMCHGADTEDDQSRRARSSSPNAAITATEALARLANIEARLDSVERTLPLSWHTKRVWLARETGSTASCTTLVVPPGHLPLFLPYYDLYADHFIVQTRNVARMTRISIHQLTRQLVNANPETRTVALVARRDAAADVVERICREICASVPQFLLPDARPENSIPFVPLQTLQCYMLIKPLHTVGSVSVDEHVRAWAVTALRYIAEHGGVSVAKTVADLLETTPETSTWRIYAMLGGYALAA